MKKMLAKIHISLQFSHLPPNHWSNLEKCEGLFKVINYLSIFFRQKEGAWLPGRPALPDYYEYFQRSRQRRNETIMCKE